MRKTARKWKRLKEDLAGYLQAEDFSQGLSEVLRMPPRQVINPLISLFLSSDEMIRWRAITAAGRVVAKLADEDIESARTIMRRFMWMLNDESGGIGWGVPEAMGEVVASHDRLGSEYAGILVSYVCPERNYLEYEPLQRGALWAIGRVAETKADLVAGAAPCLLPNLDASDAPLQGLSARAVGLMAVEEARDKLHELADDQQEITYFSADRVVTQKLGSLAREALSKITTNRP